MYFQERFGFRPAQFLRCEPVDKFFAGNLFQERQWEQDLSDVTGIDLYLLRMVLCMFALVPVNFVLRFIPGVTARHWYATLSGALLLYYPFGNQVTAVLVMGLTLYVLMCTTPKLAGTISWPLCFTMLLLWMERSGDLWSNGGVDVSGALMVLTLKLIAVCTNLSDGVKGVAPTTAERAVLRLDAPPPLLPFMSYLFASGNLIAGPFFEYQDYIYYMERRGKWILAFESGGLRDAAFASARASGLSVFTLTLYLAITAYVPIDLLRGERVYTLSLPARCAVAFLCGALLPSMLGIRAFAKRCSYYFVWFASEAALNMSGFGFSDLTAEGPSTRGAPARRHGVYDRYNNADMLAVETCNSMAQVARYWNKNTGLFLRHYVYLPLGGNFFGLLCTQLVSGLWHGLREGYMAFFIMSIFMFHGSKVLFKHEFRLPRGTTEHLAYVLGKWFVSHLQLNVFCIPFTLLDWESFIHAWTAFYYVPHIIALGLCVLGAVVPPPRRKPSQAVFPVRHDDGSVGGPEEGTDDKKAL